ncbi:hypothetical protein PVAP13_4KG293300 [Panicum virgatum]|uniref:Uncharacterized protein n=1 Tax=Panicum virgatum TaxID=38727 RepID=A0A8T0TUH5_PANVG|nr:hypothetical protein PVAP13_4KG293300 [Panicum virgatum]
MLPRACRWPRWPYLARKKALCALRGMMKLQTMVRGQLVRCQVNVTLRRMQALIDAQRRAPPRGERHRGERQGHGGGRRRRRPSWTTRRCHRCRRR